MGLCGSYVFWHIWCLTVMPSVLWCCSLGGRKGIRPVKNTGRWWRWALLSPDGGAPSRMVTASASVYLPLHHKVQKFSSGTGSPGWSWKKSRKMVVVRCGVVVSKSTFNGWLTSCPRGYRIHTTFSQGNHKIRRVNWWLQLSFETISKDTYTDTQ